MTLLSSSKWKIVCDHCISLRNHRPISEYPGNSATVIEREYAIGGAIEAGWRVMSDSTWACPGCKAHIDSSGALGISECPFANVPEPTPEERLDSLRLELHFWASAYEQLWSDVSEIPSEILDRHGLSDCLDFSEFADRMFRKRMDIANPTTQDINDAIALSRAKKANELKGKGL